MNKFILFSGVLTLAILLSFSVDSVFAHPHSGSVLISDHTHESQTEIISLNGIMGIEKSTIFFHASETNALPWGFVEGNVINPVEGYPVIIQIFQNNDAVHFAQTTVEENGKYEHKFRVSNSENGIITKIFEGDYLVTIFKVVYLNQDMI